MTAGACVSSEHGAIEAVLFAVPAAVMTEEPGVVDALASAAGAGIAVTVVTHAAAADALRAAMPAATQVVAVSDDAPLSVWIQDQSLAFETPDGATALQTGPRLSLGDWPVRRVEGLVPIDGGNLLVGADYALVGRDELAFWAVRRADPPPADESAALALFAADYGLPARVVPVGAAEPAESPFGRTEWRGETPWRIDPDPGIVAKGSRQAVFHIDVYLTPAGRADDGRPRLLVGDPARAAALAGLDPPAAAYAARFDADAAALAAAGFAVVRNPLPAIGIDVAHRRRRTRHLLSANNAWVEATGVAVPTAWVPLFSRDAADPLAAVDAAMLALWADLGFRTRPVRGLTGLARRNGGLNCASRILRRRPGRFDG